MIGYKKLLFLLLVIVSGLLACGQTTISGTSDSIPYKVVVYEVKNKSISVTDLAQKLKVDAEIIVKLNKYKSAKRTLFKGQKVKIPVYPKVKLEKKVKEKKAKPESQSIPSASESPPRDVTHTPYYDLEKDRNRLLLVEAHRELNEAMLEGVMATLDSFNVKEITIVNEKNIDATLQNMKRNRDRALWKPYVEHVRDSLTYEIVQLKNEQKLLEERINLSPPIAVRTDTVIAQKDTIIYFTAVYDDTRGIQKTVQEVKIGDDDVATTKKSVTESTDGAKKIKRGNKPTIADTIIVMDVTPIQHKGSKPASELSESFSDTLRQIDLSFTTVKRTAQETVDSVPETEFPNTTPNTKEPIIILADVSLSNADSIRRIKAEFFLKRSKKAFADKNFKNATAYVKKSLELYPAFFEAIFFKAEMEEVNGSLQNALKIYRLCEGLDSSRHELYLAIGNVYMKLKRKTEAFQAFDKSITLRADNIPALVQRATIFSDWKKYAEAIRDYDSVLSINRVYHFAYKARGQVKLLVKDFANAIDDFTRFIIFEESDPSAFYYRGLAKIGNNELVDGCMDLSTSASMGSTAAEKAIKKSCE